MSNFQSNPSPLGGTPVTQAPPSNPGLHMGSPLPLPQPGSATPQGFNSRNQQQPMRGSPTPYMNPKSSAPSSPTNTRDARTATSTMAGEAINEVDDSEVFRFCLITFSEHFLTMIDDCRKRTHY